MSILAILSLATTSAHAQACPDMYTMATASGGVCGTYDIYNPPTPAISPTGIPGDYVGNWVPLYSDGTDTEPAGGEEPIRCIDGTRPMYYVDPAADGNDANWLFFFQGGGSCAGVGGETVGEACWGDYAVASERDEMSSVDNHGSQNATGMLDPDKAANAALFRNFNRVIISKCSYDRWLGTATVSATSPSGSTFSLYFHGRRIVEAVFADLADGVPVSPANEEDVTMPPLEDASLVLLAGHSGGAAGVILNGDWMAEEVRARSVADLDVRLVVDARFAPGLENEAAFDTDAEDAAGPLACATVPGGSTCDAYDFAVSGSADLVAGVLPYDAGTYRIADALQSTGAARYAHEEWGAPLDASCQATHASAWGRCHSETHVLMNHVSTPFFIRNALEDGNHSGNPTAWLCEGPDCGYDQPPIQDGFTAAEYHERVVKQLTTLDTWGTASEMEQGLDPDGPTSHGVPIGVFAPDTSTHEGILHDYQSFGLRLREPIDVESTTYAEALYEWATAPASYVGPAIEDPEAPVQWCQSPVGGACP